MGLIKWYLKQVNKLKWYDVALVKWSVFFYTLFIIVAWTEFREFILSYGWHWYLIIALVLTIPLLKKIFFDE